MSHNLKPNTDYVIVTVKIAVPKELFKSGEYADSINCLMDEGMDSGVVGDWVFTQGNNRREFRTKDKVWEGQTFGVKYEESNTAVQDAEDAAVEETGVSG